MIPFMSQQSIIELKGSSFTLPVIYLSQNNPQAIIDGLKDKVQQAPNLLKQASVVINISLLTDELNLTTLIPAIKSVGINIVGFSGCNAEKRNQVIAQGYSVLNEGKQQAIATPQNQPPLYLTTPLRSGQQVYAKDRDLVVTSLVSTGAEIIADGNIYIFSTLRGKAIAGANNNLSAKIFCTQLEAELVSIAGNYWLSEQIPLEFSKKSAIISLHENSLDIESLNII